ncbi:MAG: PD40 domain-containing protein, partial [Bdellovibrionales bacterium]|nr:PD40 domain-containing protein [Bdellovibrionales bacterium]
LDARVIRSIVYGPGNNSYPTWSPDGSQITFESDRDGNKEIYVADWDGARQRRITNSLGADADPTWNPSGDEVFFYRQESGEQANIYAYSLSSNSERQITSFSGRNTTPRISPNGRFLSYSTNRFWPGWDVCFWDLENHHENCVLKGSESYCRAAWSQSGNFLTYSGGNPGHYNIELFNLRLGSKTRLTALAGREYDPVWSPDDSHIAFVAEGQRDRNLFSLYVQGVTEEKVHQVLKTPYSIRYLSWSPAKTIDLESARIKASQEEESVASDQGYRPPYLRDESDKLDTQTPQPSPVLNEE